MAFLLFLFKGGQPGNNLLLARHDLTLTSLLHQHLSKLGRLTNSYQQELEVVLLAHQFLLLLVPHGLDLAQQLRLPLVQHFPQFLTGGMNLLLNLLGLSVHLSNHLVNNGDGLGKTAVMALHLLEAGLIFKFAKK